MTFIWTPVKNSRTCRTSYLSLFSTRRVRCGMCFSERRGKWMVVSFAETTCGLWFTLASSGEIVHHLQEKASIRSKGLLKTDTSVWIHIWDDILFLGLVSTDYLCLLLSNTKMKIVLMSLVLFWLYEHKNVNRMKCTHRQGNLLLPPLTRLRIFHSSSSVRRNLKTLLQDKG